MLENPADPQWIGYHLSDALYTEVGTEPVYRRLRDQNRLQLGFQYGVSISGLRPPYAFVPLEREMILYIKSLNPVGKYIENYDTLNVSLACATSA